MGRGELELHGWYASHSSLIHNLKNQGDMRAFTTTVGQGIPCLAVAHLHVSYVSMLGNGPEK